MADVLHVNPDLVGAAGFQLHVQRSRAVEALTDTVVRDCPPTVGAHDLSAPVDRMPTQRRTHRAPGHHWPPDHGKVMALDLTPLQLLDQHGMRLQRTRYQQAATGVLVEPVHQTGPGQGGKSGVEVQQRVDQCAR